jgi:excinuclease UvrABC ATPase subunit
MARATIIRTTYHSKNEDWKSNKPFEGVIPNVERRLLETDSNSQHENWIEYQSSFSRAIPATATPEARSAGGEN